MSKLCVDKCSVSEICKHCYCEKETAEDDLAVKLIKRKGSPRIIPVIEMYRYELSSKQYTSEDESIGIIIGYSRFKCDDAVYYSPCIG